MNFRIALFLSLLFFSVQVKSQTDPNDFIEQIIESLSEDFAEDYDYSELAENLNYRLKHPLNLNRASAEQLAELIFLSPLQVNELIEYRNRNGELIDLLELQCLPSFDQKTIKNLIPFCSIDTPNPFQDVTLGKLITEADTEIMVSFAQVLEKQKGYRPGGTLSSPYYTGSPQKFLTRYRYSLGESLSASLTMEKDPGERFFSGDQKYGFDFYSANISYKGRGRIQKLIVGDYSLQFGQGLTMWSGLSFGKSASVASITKNNTGLRPYSSTNELLYFRGVATSIKLNQLTFTPFISLKKIDGTLEGEVEGVVSSPVSGFHRSLNEIDSKNKVQQTVYGGNIQYAGNRLRLGTTIYHTRLSYPMLSEDTDFKFSGSRLTNLGAYYNYNYRNLYFFGEASHSLGSGYAFLNGAIASLTRQLSLIVLQRNYQKDYHSFFNQAISEGTNAANEKGLYSGLNFVAGRKAELNIYTDVFKFPWLKFRADAPSSGFEILSQFAYNPSKKIGLVLRYKYEQKEENGAEAAIINQLVPVTKQNYRLELNYKINPAIRLRSRFEISSYNKESVQESGHLVFQDFIYHPLNAKFSGNFRFAIFNTPGFNSRVYAFENDMLYNYSLPAYQNQGTRFYVNGNWKMTRFIDFWCRYSITSYTNLESIGTGPDTIDGNKKSDLKLQLRLQF